MSTEMGRKLKRTFTPEFKAEAVSRVRSGRSIADVARELDVHQSGLNAWVKEAALREGLEPGHVVGLKPDEKEELIRLRRENTRLKEEKEILKKAMAFFAKENT